MSDSFYLMYLKMYKRCILGRFEEVPEPEAYLVPIALAAYHASIKAPPLSFLEYQQAEKKMLATEAA